MKDMQVWHAFAVFGGMVLYGYIVPKVWRWLRNAYKAR